MKLSFKIYYCFYSELLTHILKQIQILNYENEYLNENKKKHLQNETTTELARIKIKYLNVTRYNTGQQEAFFFVYYYLTANAFLFRDYLHLYSSTGNKSSIYSKLSHSKKYAP